MKCVILLMCLVTAFSAYSQSDKSKQPLLKELGTSMSHQNVIESGKYELYKIKEHLLKEHQMPTMLLDKKAKENNKNK